MRTFYCWLKEKHKNVYIQMRQVSAFTPANSNNNNEQQI